MTDMATGAGATASCPNCGEQVQVTEVAGLVVRCPACGARVEAGVRDRMVEDVTVQELERAYGVHGYDAETTVDGDGLRCAACKETSEVGRWTVDQVRRAGPPDGVVAAAHCPSCDAAGLLVLDELATRDADDLIRALERRAA